MSSLSTSRFPTSPEGSKPQVPHTPPPKRLPKFLLQQLARPLATSDDVDELMAHLHQAESRGLL